MCCFMLSQCINEGGCGKGSSLQWVGKGSHNLLAQLSWVFNNRLHNIVIIQQLSTTVVLRMQHNLPQSDSKFILFPNFA